MSKSIYSSGDNDYQYIAGVNDSCISFIMEPECSNGDSKNTYSALQNFNGLIAQSITCSCARQPTIVYEIGTKNYYAVDAKPQGTGRLQNILGPTKESIESLRILGDICNPTRISINIKKCSCFCDNSITKPKKLDEERGLTFTGGFLSNVALSATSKDLVVQGSWDFMFQDLQMTGRGGGPILDDAN